MIYPPGEKLSYLLIFVTIKNFFGVYNLEHPSQILKVTFHFDICRFVQISRKLGGGGGGLQVAKMCYILGNKPSTL